MSYDIYLRENYCDHCERGEDVGRDWNYTSNMAPAWRAAGADLAEFHGKRARYCLPLLEQAIDKMEADPERFVAFDSPNGWGKMRTLLPKLRQLRQDMRDHPDAVVRVRR